MSGLRANTPSVPATPRRSDSSSVATSSLTGRVAWAPENSSAAISKLITSPAKFMRVGQWRRNSEVSMGCGLG